MEAVLSHTKWDCKYHIIFIPKCRRRTIYAELRPHLGQVFRRLAQQKESRIEEGHLLADHVHMLISIPPKYAVSQVVGFIRGKSAIHLARVYGEKKRTFVGQHFWARGLPEVTYLAYDSFVATHAILVQRGRKEGDLPPLLEISGRERAQFSGVWSLPPRTLNARRPHREVGDREHSSRTQGDKAGYTSKTRSGPRTASVAMRGESSPDD
jgi:putative transposase